MSDPFPPPDPQYGYDPYAAPPPLAAQPSGPRWVVPAVAGAVALALVVGAGVVLSRLGREQGTAAVTAADCGPVTRHQVPEGSLHKNGPIDYDANPPHSGMHNPVPLPRSPRISPDFVDDSPERAVHNLEHAYVVVWFDDRATTEMLSELAGELADARRPKVLAVRWRQRMAEPFVLAAWGATQPCARPTSDVIAAFYDAERGRAPEPNAL
jgi:hypothetical protein